MLATSYTLSSSTDHDFADTVARVRDELEAEGFSVICEIDVQAKLKEKLCADRDPYIILGVCNQTLAQEALTTEPDLGTLLPCNVVVYEHGGRRHISAIDAERMLSLVGNTELEAIAATVRAQLANVVERATAD